MRDRFKVLLIEDDEDDFVLVQDMLSESTLSRFDLEWVESYEAGLSAACEANHDVVLLDYRLGDRNGLELLRDLVEAGCQVPVILLTGQGGYDIDVEAMEAGAADYLVKGEVRADTLERTIRYSIERKNTEHELRKYRDHLEDLVGERTAELETANQKLQLEIEERKRAEEALKESEERYRALVESALDIIYTSSPDGTIVSLNPAFEAITGWKASEWIGKSFAPLFHPKDIPILRERLGKLSRGELLEPSEARIRSKAGEYRIIEFKSVPRVKSGSVIGVLGTARDVTERRQMEEALRSARDELEIGVQERTAELARANEMLRAEVDERRRAEKALRLDESRLEALLDLSQMTEATPEQIADFVLDEQVRLTRSKVGWLGFMNEDETALTLHAWSKEVVKLCRVSGEEMHFSIDEGCLHIMGHAR